MRNVDVIQHEAKEAWRDSGESGTLEMCTGSGKSKCAIDLASELVNEKPDAMILLLVPTRKLRDDNWMKEFKKWGESEVYFNNVKTECYATAYKYKNTSWDLVIADEIHNSLSDNYSEFYRNNTYSRILGLSATINDRETLEEIAPVCFTYSLDEGIDGGVVSPYELIIIDHSLDTVKRSIKAGNKTKVFYQTEEKAYEWKSKVLKKALDNNERGKAKFAALNRLRFMYTIPSKVEPCKKLVKFLIDAGKRVVLFSESKDVIDKIISTGMHSGKSEKENDRLYSFFNSKRIPIIGSAKKLKEGVNLTDVDCLIILSYSSSGLDFNQKMGRALRFSPGKQAKVFIFRTVETQEEKWFANMSDGMDISHSKIIKSNEL